MAQLLMKTTDVFRVDTEEEAMAMVEEAKDGQSSGGYTLTKGGYTAKPKKSKGVVEYIEYKVTIEKTFE